MIRFLSSAVPNIGSFDVAVGISITVLVNPVPEDIITGFSGFLHRTFATGSQLWGSGGKYLNPVMYSNASSTGKPVMYFSFGWKIKVTVVFAKTWDDNTPKELPL